jgi:DNA-binding NarL/FixJ family response regulator
MSAPDVWRALLAGRYRIRGWNDRGQRRELVLAPVIAGRRRPLTVRQCRMLALRARGTALKVIAYEFELSVPAVSQALSYTLQQLGLSSTAALVAVFGAAAGGEPGVAELAPHPGLRLEPRDHAGDEGVVLSFPLPGTSGLPRCLSKAEGEVASALLLGLSNAEVAARRGVSHRTVANQIAAVFTKLRVRSRLELVLSLQGARELSPALAGAAA